MITDPDLPDFKAWYAEHLKVGGMPNPMDLDPNGRLADREVFINVSDVYDGSTVRQLDALGARCHWFPLGEIVGLSVSSIYGAMNMLFSAYVRDRPTYLHCAAGINRSQTVADCFHYLMSGQHRPRPSHWHHIGREYPDAVMLRRNCERGKLPSLPMMEAWLTELGKTISCIGGGELDATRMKAGFAWGEPKEEIIAGRITLFETSL